MEDRTVRCQNLLVSQVLVVQKGGCKEEREYEIREEEKKEQNE